MEENEIIDLANQVKEDGDEYGVLVKYRVVTELNTLNSENAKNVLNDFISSLSDVEKAQMKGFDEANDQKISALSEVYLDDNLYKSLTDISKNAYQSIKDQEGFIDLIKRNEDVERKISQEVFNYFRDIALEIDRNVQQMNEEKIAVLTQNIDVLEREYEQRLKDQSEKASFFQNTTEELENENQSLRNDVQILSNNQRNSKDNDKELVGKQFEINSLKSQVSELKESNEDYKKRNTEILQKYNEEKEVFGAQLLNIGELNKEIQRIKFKESQYDRTSKELGELKVKNQELGEKLYDSERQVVQQNQIIANQDQFIVKTKDLLDIKDFDGTLEEVLDKIEGKTFNYKQKIRELEERSVETEETLKGYTSNISELNKKITGLEKENTGLKEENTLLHNQVVTKDGEIENLQNDLRLSQDKNKNLEGAVSEKDKENQDLKSQLSAKDKSLEDQKNSYEQKLSYQENTHKSTIENYESKLLEMQRKMDEMIKSHEEAIKLKDLELKNVNDTIILKDTQLEGKDHRISDLKDNIKSLEEANAKLKEDHKKEISALTSKHEQEIENQNKKHEEALVKQSKANENKVVEVEKAHERSLAEINSKHEEKLKELQGSLEGKDVKISSLEGSVTLLQETNSKQANDNNEAIEKLKEEHKKAIEAVNEKHELKIVSIRTANEYGMNALQESHKKDVEKLTENYESKIAGIENNHKQEISNLKNDHEKATSEKDKIIDNKESENGKLKEENSLLQKKNKEQDALIGALDEQNKKLTNDYSASLKEGQRLKEIIIKLVNDGYIHDKGKGDVGNFMQQKNIDIAKTVLTDDEKLKVAEGSNPRELDDKAIKQNNVSKKNEMIAEEKKASQEFQEKFGEKVKKLDWSKDNNNVTKSTMKSEKGEAIATLVSEDKVTDGISHRAVNLKIDNPSLAKDSDVTLKLHLKDENGMPNPDLVIMLNKSTKGHWTLTAPIDGLQSAYSGKNGSQEHPVIERDGKKYVLPFNNEQLKDMYDLSHSKENGKIGELEKKLFGESIIDKQGLDKKKVISDHKDALENIKNTVSGHIVSGDNVNKSPIPGKQNVVDQIKQQ